ncbi:type II toxin-antitoxin system HipA family toxin [Ralstonia sp. ASV6]|uniref:type II toxin-antitoxin system HipA family toxin n=1 Tax=Ralstonia sp. ASV6 TaxID=2795124 RepID=UPI0018EE0C79|nr:type II toxin-antitoxin system HipA family toxin [Ralstonia sp. ASV6]
MAGSKRANKSVESPLFVYTDMGGELVWVGTLDLDDSAGDAPMNVLAEFRYAPTYLARADAQPLDPLNLPLREQIYRTTSRYHVLGVLFDSAPDAWGRTVLRADNDGVMPSERTVFVRGRGLAVGSLFFAPTQLPEGTRTADALPPLDDVVSLDNILTLETALATIDAGGPLDDAWRDMLSSSWDIGGARPKAIVRDSDNGLWIAKFPREKDSYDRQRVEWANLAMARDLGMHVPETRLLEVEQGAVLLVRRFDREVVNGALLRKHYISAASLVSPAPDFDKRLMDQPIGAATFSYARVADIIRRVSPSPAHDLQELYGRMVLNVCVHNTDDHLKNTGFLLETGGRGAGGLRLSPLFDVVTQEGSSKHMLHIGPSGRESSFENALAGAARMHIRPAAAREILTRVKEVVARRHEYYRQARLSDREIAIVEQTLSAWRHTAQPGTKPESTNQEPASSEP